MNISIIQNERHDITTFSNYTKFTTKKAINIKLSKVVRLPLILAPSNSKSRVIKTYNCLR